MTPTPGDQPIHKFLWQGCDESYLDAPAVTTCGGVIIGCYGGNTDAGASHNEDSALVWCAGDGSWEFALVLDAHGSSQSAGLVVAAVEAEAEAIAAALAQPVAMSFTSLHRHLLSVFQSPAFRSECRRIEGETACLICARKEQFLWWLSVGDCVVYLFHPELAQLEQYALNQRSFFEWIGHANTFDLPVLCYASGVRELRSGRNRILMTTDGLLECGKRPFKDALDLYQLFAAGTGEGRADLEASVRAALLRVHEEKGRDSATVIAWACESRQIGLQPSSLRQRVADEPVV